MLYILPLLLLIAVLVAFIRDYRHLYRINPTTDILFATDPEKKQIDLMVEDGYPIVILDKIKDQLTLKDLAKNIPETQITYSYKTKDKENTIKMKDIEKHKKDMLLLKNTNIVTDSKINSSINNVLEGFNRKLVYYPETNIYSHIVSKDTRIPLRKNTNDTNIIIVMEGNIRFFMVSPLYNGNLYEENNTTPIDIWAPDYKKYPLYKNSKISSDTLHEKEILYIPPKWWYAIYTPSECFMIQVQRENMISSYL
jgi:hypothetical protein